MQRTFDYVKHFSVNDISLADRAGVIRQTLTSPELVGRDFSFRKYFQRLREPPPRAGLRAHHLPGLPQGAPGDPHRAGRAR